MKKLINATIKRVSRLLSRILLKMGERVLICTICSPMHFHWSKMEDIINRGCGNILIRVYNSTPDGEYDKTDVKVCMDGREFYVAPGMQVKLTPGESITIYPYLYHDFTVEQGTGAVLLGEVSMCNDDDNDNRFYEKLGRFPTIEEDKPAYRQLCGEYPKRSICPESEFPVGQ